MFYKKKIYISLSILYTKKKLQLKSQKFSVYTVVYLCFSMSVLRNIDKEKKSHLYASQWSMINALDLKPLGRGQILIMSWQRTKPLRQVQKLDPVVILMSLNHPLNDLNVNRYMSYVYMFWDFNYLNVVLFKYLRFILHVYMFFIYNHGATCDNEM